MRGGEEFFLQQPDICFSSGTASSFFPTGIADPFLLGTIYSTYTFRHGQYNLQGTNDKERSLTDLGKQQAAVTAARSLKEIYHSQIVHERKYFNHHCRLATLSLPYSHITHSNMTR